MYILGMIALLVVSLASIYLNAPPIIASLALFIAPGLYYFNKNKVGIKDAIVSSALFGFTMLPVYLLIDLLVSLMTPRSAVGSSFGMPAISQWLVSGDWLTFIIDLILSGLIYSVSTLIAWLILGKFREDNKVKTSIEK